MRLSPTPRQYVRYVSAAGVSLVLIVFTGAAVRLTDAGLGCDNWPSCTDQSLTPTWELHGWIEFGNRLLSGVVAVAVCLAVLTAYRRRPVRRDLLPWAWGLVIGTAAQVVLGGITVLVDLHPASVGAHYLLSMVLLWNVTVLWFRASGDGPNVTPNTARRERNLGRVVIALATAVSVLGTVVTGTGPNGGDPDAERLPFVFQSVARLHGASVWLFVATATLLAVLLHRTAGNKPTSGAPLRAVQLSRWLLLAAITQGLIGYTQYLRGVPPLLVELHIIGAVSVWLLSISLYLAMFDRRSDASETPTTGGLSHGAVAHL